MNNNYETIDDKNNVTLVKITNEEGDSTIRRIPKESSVYYTLLSENKMELIGLKKSEIEIKINDALDRLNTIKLTSPLFPIVLCTVGGFLILVKIFKPEALIGDGWKGIAVGVLASEVMLGTVAIVEHIYSKKEIKVLKEQLKALEKYEQEPLYCGELVDYKNYDFKNENEILSSEINAILKRKNS